MITYKPGDYLLTSTGKLYRIVDSYIFNTEALYDIKSLEPYKKDTYHSVMCLSNKSIDLFGRVIPEERMSKLAKLFYSK